MLEECIAGTGIAQIIGWGANGSRTARRSISFRPGMAFAHSAPV